MGDGRSPIAGIAGKRTESADIDGPGDPASTCEFAGFFTPFEGLVRTTENRGSPVRFRPSPFLRLLIPMGFFALRSALTSSV
jgi:hypothetical protein